MKHLSKWTALILSLCLCLAAAFPALAAEGDKVVYHLKSTEGYWSGYLTYADVLDGDVYVFMNGEKELLRVYPADGSEAAEYAVEQPVQEETADGMYTVENTVCWFIWQGGLYALRARTTSGGDVTEVDGGYVMKAELKDGAVTFSDAGLPKLDWDNMIEDYGNWKSSRSLNSYFVQGDSLIGSTWDQNGNTVLMRFDLQTGAAEELYIQDVNGLFAGPEGSVYVTRFEWGDVVKARIFRYDLAAGTEEEIGVLEGAYNTPSGLCWDESKNLLYYIYNGEVLAAPGGDVTAATPVTDCPATGETHASLMPDGRLMIWSQSDVILRNPDPAARAEQLTLTVQDYAYGQTISETNFDFTTSSADRAVILRRDGDTASVLQAMMNQDDTVDIYTLNYSASEFEALRSRGYLADLSGNADIVKAVDRMYPYLQEALKTDGKLTAIPLDLYGNTFGIRADIMEKAGITREELPTTWEAFFDWLNALPERLAGTDIQIFDAYTTRNSLRWDFLSLLLNQYQAYLNEGGADYTFNTPLLRGLLQRLDEVNWDALGLRDPEEGGEEMYSGEYREPLIDTYASLTVASWGSTVLPFTPSLEEGAEPVLPVNLSVAFVNPYSRHPAEAAEYLALSMNNYMAATRYTLFSDLTEPVREPYYEENRKQQEGYLESAKEALAAAQDDMERETWGNVIHDYEESLADLEKTAWLISGDAIENYRAIVPFLKPLSYDFTTQLYSDAESAGSFYELLDGYTMGSVSAEELLTAIDRKVQMMRLEGN